MHIFKNFFFYFLCIFLLHFGFHAQLFAQTDSVFSTKADQMPYFSGCTIEKNQSDKRNCSNQNLVAFISNQLNYPDTARVQGIEGIVYVSFIVNEVGKVVDATILRDIGGECGKEALRILGLMPSWEPAIAQNKPVKVKLNLPIHFQLSDEQEFSKYYTLTWGKISGDNLTRNQLKALMRNEIIVRDHFGKQVNVQALNFIYEKGRKLKEAGSAGIFTEEMQEIVRKAKSGSTITIVATIPRNNNVVYVEKVIKVVD
jgi:TonB family protein